MRIRWTPPVVADLESISQYLRDRHPEYREATMRRIYNKIRSLKDAPYLGRPGAIDGTRELPFPPLPFLAVYRVSGETVEVLRVFHGAQSRQ